LPCDPKIFAYKRRCALELQELELQVSEKFELASMCFEGV